MSLVQLQPVTYSNEVNHSPQLHEEKIGALVCTGATFIRSPAEGLISRQVAPIQREQGKQLAALFAFSICFSY